MNREPDFDAEFDPETEGLDPDGPSAADLDRFGSEFRPCPECGAEVYDQMPLCPECGHAFEERTSSPAAMWLVAAAIAVVLALTFLIVAPF